MDKIAVFIICLIAFGILFKILLWIYQYLSLRRKLSSIPGPKSVLFLGMLLEVRKIPSEGMYLSFNKLLYI